MEIKQSIRQTPSPLAAMVILDHRTQIGISAENQIGDFPLSALNGIQTGSHDINTRRRSFSRAPCRQHPPRLRKLWLPSAEHADLITGDAQDDAGEPIGIPDDQDTTAPEDALWLALCTAPDEGAEIAELIRLTGMSRATLYRHLAQHTRGRRAIQVSRGRWRATTTEDPR